MLFVRDYGILRMPVEITRRAEHCIATAGGWLTLPKGGESYANYFDLPFVWIYIYDQSKTLKPPPARVTVSFEI